jgi:hypothetical protein
VSLHSWTEDDLKSKPISPSEATPSEAKSTFPTTDFGSIFAAIYAWDGAKRAPKQLRSPEDDYPPDPRGYEGSFGPLEAALGVPSVRPSLVQSSSAHTVAFPHPSLCSFKCNLQTVYGFPVDG